MVTLHKKKILLVFGTRPEAIKMVPVFKDLNKETDIFDVRLCVTAQHREMLDQVLSFFRIIPNYDLNLMKPNQNLYSLTWEILMSLKNVLDDFNPDLILVHGDTTTSFASALAGFYGNIKIGHIEAGLRTYDKTAPFPEEINRQLTGRLADYHFAPTLKAKNNLLKELVLEENIVVTGNTVIDALFDSIELIKKLNDNPHINFLKQITGEDDIILVTGHRRENFGTGFLNICEALKEIAQNFIGKIIYPVHLNPNVSEPVRRILGNTHNIKLIDPLPYEAFIWLMNRSKLIITDSGGVQEEAPSLGKPVLVMRETTERPEAVEAGTVILVGTNQTKIVNETMKLLTDAAWYQKMSSLHNPYGDGKAAQRIVKFIKEKF